MHKFHTRPTLFAACLGKLSRLIALALIFPLTATAAEDLFALARAAGGGSSWSRVAQIDGAGIDATIGLQAKWRLSEDVRRGRFAQVLDFGVFGTEDIFDGATRWRKDRSGGVHALDGAFSRSYAATDAWLARRAYLKPGAEGARIGPMSVREEAGRSYTIVSATPRDGTSAELWFDSSTHLLDRVLRERPTHISVVRYADYRSVHGLMLPFRITSGDEDDPADETVSVAQYVVLSHARAAAFNKPTAPSDTELLHPTEVPVAINGEIIVAAMLNGQGPFEFILDTGGHNILTPAVAGQLGLVAVGAGHSGGAGEGQVAEQDVRVQSLKVGDAVISDQHFFVIPLGYSTTEQGTRPALAGILGLELFERLQASIDYEKRSLTLAPFSTAGLCRGKEVPLQFDEDIPLIDGSIDGHPGVIAIDTGNSGSTVIQGVWAVRNGMADSLKRGIATVSFGAGGASYNWISRGHVVGIGSEAVAETELRYAEDRKGSFSSRTEAANAGRFVLANFRVGFDYSHRRMCLDRAAGFVLPPMNRSGLGLSKDEPASFTVVQVRENSPAALAGIQSGDKILAIDGQSATSLSYNDVYEIIRRSPGTHLRVDLLRAGQSTTAEIVLQDPQ